MAGKLEPPKLDPIDDPAVQSGVRPELRAGVRRPTPEVGSLIAPGFVTEARLPERVDPEDVP